MNLDFLDMISNYWNLQLVDSIFLNVCFFQQNIVGYQEQHMLYLDV